MTEVIKKDNSKEDFSEEKIRKSIESAANEAAVAMEKAREVVEQVSNMAINMGKNRDEVKTTTIRETILNKLDEIEPSISNQWRQYDEKTKG